MPTLPSATPPIFQVVDGRAPPDHQTRHRLDCSPVQFLPRLICQIPFRPLSHRIQKTQTMMLTPWSLLTNKRYTVSSLPTWEGLHSLACLKPLNLVLTAFLRSYFSHFGPRAPVDFGLPIGCQSSRHLHKTSFPDFAFDGPHGPYHTDYNALFTRHRHWPWGASAPRASSSSTFPR